MSLINDMLKDLERTRNGKAAGPSLLTGVQAVTGVTRRGARRPLLAVLILLVGLGLGGGLRLLLPAGSQPAPVARVEVPAPVPAVEPVAAEAQPAVVVTESAPAPQEPVAAAAPAAQTPTPTPAPQPSPAPIAVATAAQPAVVAEVSPKTTPQPKPLPVTAAAPSNAPKAAAPQAAAVPAPVAVKTLPTAAVLLQEARGLLKNGQDGLAAERLEQALNLEPAAFAPRELLADLHLRHGRRSAALELWHGGVKLAPAEVHWRKRLARALLEDGDGAGAIAQLQLGAQPTVAADVEFHGLLAAAYQRQGEPSRAAAVYRRLAEQEPRGGIWWLGLAIALEGLRDGEGAKNAYQQALSSEGLGEEARSFAAGRSSQLGR